MPTSCLPPRAGHGRHAACTRQHGAADHHARAPLVLEADAIPLYTTQFTYRTTAGGSGDWNGANTLAAITPDRSAAFLALPIIDDDGSARFAGPDGGDAGAREALRLLLQSLRFPTN